MAGAFKPADRSLLDSTFNLNDLSDIDVDLDATIIPTDANSTASSLIMVTGGGLYVVCDTCNTIINKGESASCIGCKCLIHLKCTGLRASDQLRLERGIITYSCKKCKNLIDQETTDLKVRLSLAIEESQQSRHEVEKLQAELSRKEAEYSRKEAEYNSLLKSHSELSRKVNMQSSTPIASTGAKPKRPRSNDGPAATVVPSAFDFNKADELQNFFANFMDEFRQRMDRLEDRNNVNEIRFGKIENDMSKLHSIVEAMRGSTLESRQAFPPAINNTVEQN